MDSRLILIPIILLSYFLFAKKHLRGYITFICLLLFLEAALRHVSVGIDTYAYYLDFIKAKSYTWSSIWSDFKDAYVDRGFTRDPGYMIVEKIFLLFSDSWQLYLSAISALFFFGLWRLLSLNVEKPIHALFAFILYVALFHIIILCVLRQAFCMGIFFLSTPLLIKKKWVPFVIIVLLSSTIHQSMLLTLFMIPLLLIASLNRKRLLVVAFFAVPAIVLYAKSIISFMATQIESEYYMGYAESEGRGGAVIYFLLCAAVAIYVYFCSKEFDSWKRSLHMAGIILLTVTSPLIIVDGAMIRISQYFAFFMMFAIPIALDHNEKFSKTLYIGIIAALIFLTFRTEFSYNFFWQSVPGYSLFR